MALLLFKPHLDQWKPGEHTGTFRGNNLAFVASKVSLDNYWQNDNLSKAVKYKEEILKDSLTQIANKYKDVYDIDVRGRGLVYGFEIKMINQWQVKFLKSISRGINCRDMLGSRRTSC